MLLVKPARPQQPGLLHYSRNWSVPLRVMSAVKLILILVLVLVLVLVLILVLVLVLVLILVLVALR
jgi:hypothetical protein